MTTAGTHPDLESLSALIDGRLAGAERAQMIEHLARCEDCFEVVAETGEVQEELKEALEAEETSLPGGAFDPGPPRRAVPDNVVLHPSAWKRWAPAAAALAATLVVAVFGAWQVGWLLGPDLSVQTLAGRLEGSAARLDTGDWTAHGWPVARGEGTSLEARKAAFGAGVYAVDLQLALRLGNRERATDSAEELVKKLRGSVEIGPLRGDYEVLVLEALQGDEPLAEIAERAAAVEDKVMPLINELYYELGKWAETGRLAALAGDRDTLRSRSLRGALKDFRKAGLDEDVTARLGEIRERLRGDLSDAELEGLVNDFQSLIGGEGVRVREPPAMQPPEE